MRVLLTGADGYIGAIMGPKLIEAGHDVVGLDTGFYRRGWLFDDAGPIRRWSPRTSAGSSVEDLAGFDAVVHLAELSNDPIGENDPGLTMAINDEGSVGAGEEGPRRRRQALHPGLVLLDSTAPAATRCAPRPASSRRRPPMPAARSWSRSDVRALMDETFTPVFMRNATAYGASPRQRFDIVLNNLCGFAHTIGEIRMTSRRLALAADHPYRGHLRGDALRAEGAARRGGGRGVQRRRRQRELPDPRDRRDRGAHLPGLRADRGRQWAATPAATASPSPRSARTCRSSGPAGPPSAAPAS